MRFHMPAKSSVMATRRENSSSPSTLSLEIGARRKQSAKTTSRMATPRDRRSESKDGMEIDPGPRTATQIRSRPVVSITLAVKALWGTRKTGRAVASAPPEDLAIPPLFGGAQPRPLRFVDIELALPERKQVREMYRQSGETSGRSTCG